MAFLAIRIITDDLAALEPIQHRLHLVIGITSASREIDGNFEGAGDPLLGVLVLQKAERITLLLPSYVFLG